MPSKSFRLDDQVEFTVYKRRGNRHLRLSVAPSGKVRITIPAWAPYKAGIDFARSKQAWIADQATRPAPLTSGQAIGKGHHLIFVSKPGSSKVTTQVRGNTITVSHPAQMEITDSAVQQAAQKASLRSLRLQAQQLLPQRLDTLAVQYGFTYRSLQIKQLTGRWGSCDQQKHIVLSLFLMQLPWELIDYVLLHELTHTQVLRHGPDFWQAMQVVMPDAKLIKHKLQAHRPVLNAG